MEDLVKKIGDLLVAKNMTIGTAESCTAGLIGAALASVNGASRYFRGGFITYATEIKEDLLGVSHETITRYDVVSYQVAEEMAINAQRSLRSNYVISITGYAGDTGGSAQSPRGTVWICVASANSNVTVRKLFVNGKRGENIQKCVIAALELAYNVINGNVYD